MYYRCVPKTALPDAPGLSPYDHATSVTSTVRTNYAPLQCCYVVPGVGTSQTTTTSVGGTIVRHDHGIQSVEERIVSERPEGKYGTVIVMVVKKFAGVPSLVRSNILPLPHHYHRCYYHYYHHHHRQHYHHHHQHYHHYHQHHFEQVYERDLSNETLCFYLLVEPTHKVTEIVHSRPVQLPLQVQDPAVTQPTKIPHVRISLPGVSKVQLNTLIGAGHEIGRKMANGGLSQIRSNIWGLQKKNVVTRSYLSPRNKTSFVPRTHIAALRSSEKRSNINGLQSRSRKRDTTKPFLPQRNKRSFKSKNKEI